MRTNMGTCARSSPYVYSAHSCVVHGQLNFGWSPHTPVPGMCWQSIWCLSYLPPCDACEPVCLCNTLAPLPHRAVFSWDKHLIGYRSHGCPQAASQQMASAQTVTFADAGPMVRTNVQYRHTHTVYVLYICVAGAKPNVQYRHTNTVYVLYICVSIPMMDHQSEATASISSRLFSTTSGPGVSRLHHPCEGIYPA